jgi:hypothetical protein
MKRLRMTGTIHPAAVATSLAVTLLVIVAVGAFASYALRTLPVPVVIVGLGWLAAIVLGTVYERIMGLKARRLQPVPLRTRRARR